MTLLPLITLAAVLALPPVPPTPKHRARPVSQGDGAAMLMIRKAPRFVILTQERFATYSWSGPARATESVLEMTMDFKTWTPVCTNQWFTTMNCSGRCGFYRVRWRVQ